MSVPEIRGTRVAGDEIPMASSDNQQWLQRIERALAELKQPPAMPPRAPDAHTDGDLRGTRAPLAE